MNMSKKIGYLDLEDFKKDFANYRNNPQDSLLMRAIASRVKNSDKSMITAIDDEIVSGMMETNPKAFIEYIGRTVMDTRYWMVIKTANDPFFEV